MFYPHLIVASMRAREALSGKDKSKCESCAKYEECTMVGKANCLEYEEVEE